MLNQQNDLIQYGEIHYYKNVISDPKRIIEIVEDTDSEINEDGILTKWQDWKSSDQNYVFGKQKQELPGDRQKTSKDLLQSIDFIKSAIHKASRHYAETHNINIGSMSSIAIGKYLTGKTMGSHVDSGDDGPRNPVISIVLYLNDDHEGGELHFEEQGVTIEPEAGSIIIFPSKKPYFHASLPVVSGTKYVSLAFWHIDSIS